MAKIKVREAKIREAGDIPNADGYLVQHQFKNAFKDFQMSKCVFVKDLSELPALFGPDSDPSMASFYFEGVGGKTKSSVKKAIELVKTGNFKLKQSPNGPIFVYMAHVAKVWPMIDKQPPATAFSVYVTLDGKTLSSREYTAWKREWMKKVEDNFPELIVNTPFR